MNIYYVNRYSKLKGPYDIIDSNREHIIKVGDICLRDYVEGLAFLVVQSTDNSWNACKRVGVGKNQIVKDLGNTLLFSFDGLHQRKGNIGLIKQLLYSYQEKVIYDFFINAIEILEYKRDFWDVSLFQRFFANSQELIKPTAVREQTAELENHDYPTVFAKYLNVDLLDLLKASINEGKGIKEAYERLRDKDAASFRAAMMRFLVENPYGNIYEKLPYSATPQKTEEVKVVETPKPKMSEPSKEEIVDDFKTILIQDYYNRDFKTLFKRFKKGDKKAYEQLVNINLPLVANVANNFRIYGLDFDDLMQEGAIGLMTAFDRFDLSRKVPFSLYARWWIFQSITRYLLPFSKTIKMPQNQLSLYKRVRKYIENYEQKNGYEPSVLEIEDVAEIDSDIIYQLRNIHEEHLHQPSVSNDLDSFPSMDSPVDERLMKESRTIYVDGIISRLKTREASILRAAYGLGQAQIPLSEIGERFGLSRERVRQIAEKAVARLRKMLTGKKANQDDEEEETTDTDKKTDEKKNKTVKKVKQAPQRDRAPKHAFPDTQVVNYGNFKIVNYPLECEIRNANNFLLYTSQGRIIIIGKDLYRAYILNNFFFIYKVERDGLAFKTGSNIIYANKSSQLYKQVSSKDGLDLIKNIEFNLKTNSNKVFAGGNWYDKNGHLLKTEEEVEEKKIKKEDVKKAKEAAVGDTIIFASKRCVVVDIKTRYSYSRLIVKYENGSIDNINNDPSRYKILPPEKKEKDELAPKGNLLSQGNDKSEIFKTIFDKKSSSYKYFWLLSIITIAREKRCMTISYTDIIIRMVAMAWPLVIKERLDFGKHDMLPSYVNAINDRLNLSRESSCHYVETSITKKYDYLGLGQIINPLLKNVPYRFLSPWIKYTYDEEVIETSQKKSFDCMYALYDKYLIIKDGWWDYINTNYTSIWNFTIQSFADYIIRFNSDKTISQILSIKWDFYDDKQ